MKKRVLLCSEAHYINTGYAVLCNKILNGLADDPNIEIAEHASFGKPSDKRNHKCKWKFYPNSVEHDDPRHKIYKSHPTNPFGTWRFDRILLDFKPHIVLGVRDPWMDAHIIQSPLSEYYHKVLMPPIDSYPLKDEYIEIFNKVDAVCPYTEFGLEVLKRDYPKIKVKEVWTCGTDFDIFKPLDKKELRKKFGISEDLFIYGTVMRNQIRKLFPNLMKSFASMINQLPVEHSKNMYLYLHTAYPDKEGWNIPYLLKYFGISSKTIVSYICKSCKHPFSAIFQDARTLCPACNQVSAVMPNVNEGYTREQLADVYNLFDVYIQYSNCEGFGIPLIEAASCGVPVIGVDSSATKEIINNLGGYLVDHQPYFDFQNQCWRAIPNDETLSEGMLRHYNIRKHNIDPNLIVERAKKYYNWPNIIEKIRKHIYDTKIDDRWETKVPLYPIPDSYPSHLEGKEFVDFLYSEVLHDTSDRYSYFAKSIERDMHYGVHITANKVEPLNKDKIFGFFKNMATNKNMVEKMRMGMIPLIKEDYL